jgi:hypothetical protein
MNTHRYVSHIEPQSWNDLQTVKKELDTSFNKLINEGIRLVIKERFETISQQKKRRNSMQGWSI